MNNYKKSDLFRFIKSLFIILVALVIADFAIGKGLSYLYNKQKSGLLFRTSISIDSTKANYIVVGSSRANHHYDPKVFESVLNSTFYNCGRDGQGVMYSFAVVSAIIARYNPRLIIIDVRPDDFSEPEQGRLSSLLPYYKNVAIRPYLNYAADFQNVKLLSSVYPYNSLLTNLIVGLSKKHDLDYKGYIRLDKMDRNDNLDSLKERKVIDSVKVKAFCNLMDTLNKKHIRTLVVLSPMHYKYLNSITVGVCESINKKYSNSKFLNFTNIPKWQNTSLFSDDFHLNGKGATLFSTEIAKYITSL